MIEASAQNAEHNQETEPSDAESRRLAGAMGKRNQTMKAKKYIEAMRAKEIERHNQAMKNIDSVGKVLEKRKAAEAMKGVDYVDRGDYYEVVVKGPYINTAGRVGALLRESGLKEDYILFSGVPPITVKYPDTPLGPLNSSYLQVWKDFHSNIMSQVAQTIREAPKEIHAAYRQGYYKAIQEYDERAKNKPPYDPDEEIEKTRDEILSLAQIKVDQIIRNEQIRADQMRDTYRKANLKDFGNQSGQMNPQNVDVDLASMLSVKGTLEESDIEKQISNRQALVELKAKKCIAAAHAKADLVIKFRKELLASKREKYGKNYRGTDEARKFDEAMLGFKGNLSP